MKDQSKPRYTVFVDDSDEDEGPPLKKLRYDSTKDYEKIAEEKKKRRESAKEASPIETVVVKSRSERKKKKNKKKHIVCLSSDEDELSKEKSITNSMVKKENKSDRKKYDSTREESPIDATVEKPSSDRKKKSRERIDLRNGSPNEEVILIDSSVVEKKSKSDSTKKGKKTAFPKQIVCQSSDEDETSKIKSISDSKAKKEKSSDRKICSSTKDASQTESVVKRPESDSKKENDKISDRKKHFIITKESSQNYAVVEKSRSDSTRKIENDSFLDIDQNEESSSEEVSQMESVKNVRRATKRNETPIKCFICNEFRSCSVKTLMTHLNRKHSTNIGLAGLMLRCDCGHEARSEEHLGKCTVANFTLIRKKDGPIQTFHDKKVTPQCILCEKYPTTLQGYSNHLVSHHETNLKAIRKYLLCTCGFKITSNFVDTGHRKKCDGRKYTLRDVDEKGAMSTIQ